LTDQPTNSVISFLKDTQQGCLSSAEGSDFELAANPQYLSRGLSHFDFDFAAEHLS
jgi:hypothetical protein